MRALAGLCVLPAVLLAAAPVAADDVTADPNDRGSVTNIRKGVKELDLGGLFVLSYAKPESGDAETRISTLGGAGFQYFINDNFSAGANVLFNYDKFGTSSATAFGGTVFASLHVRLGLGAFLRPTFGAGALFGTQETEVVPGTVAELNQTSLLLRLGLPFAYFPSRRVVLQAGPELNISIGSVSPKDGGESASFTTVAGGFGVGVGYVF